MNEDIREPLEALDAVQKRSRLDSWHRYHVYRSDEGGWVQYQGATSIIGQLSKGDALHYWAAQQERDHDIGVAYELPAQQGEAYDDYRKRFTSRAGRVGAFKKASGDAAQRGTIVHGMIEAFLRKRLGLTYDIPASNEEEKEMFRQWVLWETAVKLEPVALEHRILDDDLRYAGTFDALVRMEGELWLLDVKTSKPLKPGAAPYDSWSLQSGAYRNALYKLGFPEMKAGIMLVPRDGGEVKLHRLEDDHKPSFDAFASLLNVRNWLLEREAHLPPPEGV